MNGYCKDCKKNVLSHPGRERCSDCISKRKDEAESKAKKGKI